MFQNLRIVSVTPAGRARYMRILLPYLLSQRHVIDEHRWWVNTECEEDLAWINARCVEYPEFFKQVPCPGNIDGNASVSLFYTTCCEEDTIYIKIDDDIVWMDECVITELLQFRLANPEYFLVYANTVNNVLIDRLRQRNGLIAYAPFVIEESGHNGWQDPRSAEAVHWSLLRHFAAGQVDRHKRIFERYVWVNGERCSINFICWFGEDMYGLQVEGDDEDFLSRKAPRLVGLPNVVCGSSLVAHFAFSPQREYMDRTPILEQYERVSRGLLPECAPVNFRVPRASDMSICFFTCNREPHQSYIESSLESYRRAAEGTENHSPVPWIVIDGCEEKWLRTNLKIHPHPVPIEEWETIKSWQIHRRIAYSYERCFEVALAEDRSGVLICEDDIEFADGFFERLDAIFSRISHDGKKAFVLSLYFPGGAAGGDSPYAPYPGWEFFGGQAVFFSRAIVEEARENWARRGWRDVKEAERPNDLMIGDFGHSLWRRYGDTGGLYRCQFDLVQHKGDASKTGLGGFYHSSTSFGESCSPAAGLD